MNRPSIFVTKADEIPHVNGMGDNTKVMIPLTVASGPKPTIGKIIGVSLSPDDALNFALNIIGQIPGAAYERADAAKQIERLNKFAALAARLHGEYVAGLKATAGQ